jgi:PAS domain S-box-containing protein
MHNDPRTEPRSDKPTELLAEILARIEHGIFALDADGSFTYMNAVAGEMLALDPQRMMGRSLWTDFPDNPEDSLRNACKRARARQEYICLEAYWPSGGGPDDQVEGRSVGRADGRSDASPAGRWMEYNIHPSASGISVVFKDITERKQAEEEWRKAELQYHALIEQASDAIMITDKAGNFIEANPSMCELVGYSRSALLGTHVSNLIDPEQLKTDPFRLDRNAAGQPELRERRMVHRNGTIIEVEANVKLAPDGRLLAILRNVTDRKRIIQQMLKEKAMSDSIINSLPGIFLLREYQGKNLRWNKQFEEISGYSAPEIPDLDVYSFYEEDEQVNVRQRVQNMLVTGKSSSEVRIVRKDGERIPFLLTAIILQLEGKTCVMVMGFDISERKKAEEELSLVNEQLRHLSAHLQNIREEERKSIALEIHDELGQQLTALKIDLSWMMKRCSGEQLLFDRLSGMDTLIDHTIDTVRRISSELRPSILDDLGLAEALDWQSTEFEKRFLIPSVFRCQVPDMGIDAAIVTGLFRIYQESLTNIARHAEAGSVSGSLRLVEGDLVLEVTDDGKGFDTEAVGKKGGFGLLGMKERTAMMGGSYSVLSSPGAGTTITVCVPLKSNQSKPSR